MEFKDVKNFFDWLKKKLIYPSRSEDCKVKKKEFILAQDLKALLLQLGSPELKEYMLREESAEERRWHVFRLWNTTLVEQLKLHHDNDFAIYSKFLLSSFLGKSTMLDLGDPTEGFLLYVKEVIDSGTEVALKTAEYLVSDNRKNQHEMSVYFVGFKKKLGSCIIRNVKKKDILGLWGVPPARKCYGGWFISADSTKLNDIVVAIFRPSKGLYESFHYGSIVKNKTEVSEICVKRCVIEDTIGVLYFTYAPSESHDTKILESPIS